MPGLLMAAKLDAPGKSTIWILPLSSMHEQYKLRTSEQRVSCESWTTQLSAKNVPRHILAAVEQSQAPEFQDYVLQLVVLGLLARIIVDELHLILTHASFRSVMDTIQWAGSHNVQIVGQTAPSLEASAFVKLGITNYVVCRSKTACPNILYNVIHAFDAQSKLKELVQVALDRSPTSFVIVFVRGKPESISLATYLGGIACHSDLIDGEVNEVLQQLRDGSTRIVVSTTILGVSLNVPSISDVIHFGYPWDYLSYTQESGRAGRIREEKAWSTILISLRSAKPKYPDPDPFGVWLMVDWIHQDSICRRIGLMTFNDGVAEPCAALDGGITHLCDVCQAISPRLNWVPSSN
jgi:superfamily II DNA helicase RecQ